SRGRVLQEAHPDFQQWLLATYSCGFVTYSNLPSSGNVNGLTFTPIGGSAVSAKLGDVIHAVMTWPYDAHAIAVFQQLGGSTCSLSVTVFGDDGHARLSRDYEMP